jgi:hypothetical protein
MSRRSPAGSSIKSYMNFLPEARVVCYDGGTKVLLEGIGQVVVPQQYVERAKQAENLNLTFGIRPAHL